MSYASEDLEAARRIANALTAAGVAVWFDQEELRGGDAWDATIRRRIKDCSLFVPILSAATQTRLEGYFRREWKLAIERTHDMAQEKSFLVPVTIDATKESDPGIPEKFLEYQWTQVHNDAGIEKFIARVCGLLVKPAAAVQPSSSVGYRAGGASPTKTTRPMTPLRLGAIVLALVAVVAAVVFALRLQKSSSAPADADVAPKAPAKPAFPTDPTLAKAWNLIYGYHYDAAGKRFEGDSTPDDFALAEELTKGVLAQRPDDPEANIVYAELNGWYQARGFDVTDERYELESKYAQRALQLASDNPEALYAMAMYIVMRTNDTGGAAQLAHQAIAMRPDESRYYRLLFYDILNGADQLAEANKAVELFPTDYLTLYDASQIYERLGLAEQCEALLDRAIALAPQRGAALVWKAYFAYSLHGDLPAMKLWLSKVPGSSRFTDRFAFFSYIYGVVTGDADACISVVNAVPRKWLHDFSFEGPKDLLMGDLLDLQGKSELARLRYLSALALCQERLAHDSLDRRARLKEAWVYYHLGKLNEARADFTLVSDDSHMPILHYWWLNPIPLGLLLGEKETALSLLTEAMKSPSTSDVTVGFRTDPRMAPWRNDPAVNAILAGGDKH